MRGVATETQGHPPSVASALPLGRYRILELAGPKGAYCGRVLADAGADLILIEAPSGSPGRRVGPFKEGAPLQEASLDFLYSNANKRGITLDIEKADGWELFRRLVALSDVLVECNDPGYLAAMALDYRSLRQLNPGLIVASITGFGQEGPYSHYRAPDIVPFAMGGLMFLSGEPGRPPVTAPCHQAYTVACTHAALGVAVALWGREATGEGQHLDVSMHECLAAQENSVSNYAVQGYPTMREGSQHRAAVPGRVFPAKDGYAHLFVSRNRPDLWRAYLDWIGKPPELLDPELENVVARRGRVAEVDPVTARFTSQHEKQQLYLEGQARHIPVAPVNEPGDFLEDPHSKARGFTAMAEHEVLGRHGIPAAPYLVEGSRPPMRRSAPSLGQHNAEVYCGELGLTKAELCRLFECGAV